MIKNLRLKTFLVKLLKKLNLSYKLISLRVKLGELYHRKDMLRFYAQFIEKGDLCFDVGANVGSRTEIFLKLGAKVVCVEPEVNVLAQLKKHFGNNPDVIIVDKALGDSETVGEMYVCTEAPGINTMSANWRANSPYAKTYDLEWNKVQSVAVTTLDKLIQLYGTPKFCKIDVEGFENTVLSGLTQAIPYLSFEYTADFPEIYKQCIDTLNSIGSPEFNFSEGLSMQFISSRWLTAQELHKLLLYSANKPFQGDVYVRFS